MFRLENENLINLQEENEPKTEYLVYTGSGSELVVKPSTVTFSYELVSPVEMLYSHIISNTNSQTLFLQYTNLIKLKMMFETYIKTGYGCGRTIILTKRNPLNPKKVSQKQLYVDGEFYRRRLIATKNSIKAIEVAFPYQLNKDGIVL